MALFPIFLKMKGRRCLVAGAGEVAESKIQSLLKVEAEVTVVAPKAKASVVSLAEEGRIHWHPREFNAAVLDEAAKRNVICNSVDDPPNCDFYFPSIVDRGNLQIAISTAGESPALAQQLRREIDSQLPKGLGPWLASLGALRREVLEMMPAGEERKLLLHTLAQREVCDLEECPSRQLARKTAAESSSG